MASVGQSSVRVSGMEDTFTKRDGTTGAAEGPDYEIKILMMIIARCSKQNSSFKLKSNEDWYEKHFDDIIGEFKENSGSGENKSKYMFLQAKHFTGKNATIFTKTKKSAQNSSFPQDDICKWFASFQTISKHYVEENFEIMYFTTGDIEDCWKQHFIKTNSTFEEILFPRSQTYREKYRGQIYGLNYKACKRAVQRICSDMTKIQNFCSRFKVFALQPGTSQLESIIKEELEITDQQRKEHVYNKAYGTLKEWWLTTGKVPVFNTNIFLREECEELFAFPARTESDFFFKDNNTLNTLGINAAVTSIIVETDHFETHIDLLSQKLEYIKKYIFSFEDFFVRKTELLAMFTTLKTPTCLIMKIRDFGATANDTARKTLTSLVSETRGLTYLRLVFLIAQSAVSEELIPENFPSPHHRNLITFSSLNRETQKRVLEHKIKFLGRETNIAKMNIPLSALEKLIDAKLLADIRRRTPVVIGDDLTDSNFDANMYISRNLNVHAFRNPREFLTSKNIQDKYFILTAEEEKTKAFQEWKLDSSSEQKKISSNILFISEEDRDKFKEASKRKKKNAVHLLRIVNSQLIWVTSKTTKDIGNEIKAYVETEIPEDTFYERWIKRSLNFKVLLVLNNAGMGKSSLAYKFHEKLVSDELPYWPILLSLNKYFDVSARSRMGIKKKISREDQFRNCDFLPKCKFFKTFLKLGRVVVILDGVDEVAPKYTESVLAVVDSLTARKVHRIIILTRTYLQDEITRSTCAVPVELQTFTRDEVLRFLQKYYDADISTKKNSNPQRLQEFTLKMVEFVFSKKQKHWTDITGVPLQTKMIADVFRERCEDYINNENKKVLPSNEDENKDFYHEFIEQKFQIYLEEKLILNPHAIDNLQEKMWKEFITAHIQCANNLIFDDTNVFLHWTVNDRDEKQKQDILKCGIVTAVTEDCTEFNHRSFAEYFCALQIKGVLLHGGTYDQVDFIFNSVLTKDQYAVSRKYINQILAGTEEDLGVLKVICDDKDFESVFKTDDSCSVLCIALQEKNVHLASKLLTCPEEKWASVRQNLISFEEDGCTALYIASLLGNIQLVRELLDSGADPNVSVDLEMAPLAGSIMGDHQAIAELLLDRGADPHTKDVDGYTFLHLVALCDQISTLRLLLNKGCKVNSKDEEGKTPLHYAATGGSSEAASALISFGAEVTCRDNEGNTPLHLAAAAQQNPKFDINDIEDSESDESYLSDDEDNNKKDDPATAELLVEHGADINAENDDGITPLVVALKFKMTNIVEFLLSRGARIYSKESEIKGWLLKRIMLESVKSVRLDYK